MSETDERSPFSEALWNARDEDNRSGNSDAYDWGFTRGFRMGWDAREKRIPIVTDDEPAKEF